MTFRILTFPHFHIFTFITLSHFHISLFIVFSHSISIHHIHHICLSFHLKNISLVQFKNYEKAFFSFGERIVCFLGNNGVGKTNLLDAIYYLCFTKSYFSRSELQNVKHGYSGFRVEGLFDVNEEEKKVVCILRETGKKEISLNDDLYVKFSLHIGKFPCVIIAPDDAQLITEGSEQRRKFVDALLSQIDATYLQSLIEYNRVVQQRNSFLKSIAERRTSERSLLDVYDEQLIRPGNYIFEKRKSFLQAILPLVQQNYANIAGTGEELGLLYDSDLMNSSFKDLLQKYRDKDLMLQRTNIGIHKDDIEIKLKAQPFKNIASQGQRKSLLFALKLAEFQTLKDVKGFEPILLLDDVFEKLDAERMHNLLERVCIQNQGQIFITDTHRERIRSHLEKLQVKYQLIEPGV